MSTAEAIIVGNDPNDYELRSEYDLSRMTIVPKGRFAPGRRAGKNVVLLASDAVSYTHLRAHETVLDLVCRLLLEKKNKKIKTLTINNCKI